jgi:hypothetical protein
VDGHRGYEDDAESQWHSGQQGYPDDGWDRRGDRGWRDDDARVPEPRTVADRPYGGQTEQAGRMDTPTNPLSAVSPAGVSPAGVSPAGVSPGPVGHGAFGPGQAGFGSPPVPPSMPNPPPTPAPPPMPAASAPPREGVYRTRRPALAALYLVAVVLAEWPAVRLFADGALGDHLSSSNAVSGLFLIVGLPLFGRGLFALQAGAGRVPDQRAGQGWLRPPVAYLTVGLALLLAAGLAAT